MSSDHNLPPPPEGQKENLDSVLHDPFSGSNTEFTKVDGDGKCIDLQGRPNFPISVGNYMTFSVWEAPENRRPFDAIEMKQYITSSIHAIYFTPQEDLYVIKTRNSEYKYRRIQTEAKNMATPLRPSIISKLKNLFQI